MGPSKTRNPLHVNVRRKLLDRVVALKTVGGRLPSERELCQSLAVSRGTLRKAIDQLIKEGLIISDPRKGNYLSQARRPLKIGVIFGAGDFSPYVPDIAILNGELEVFDKAECRVQILNLRRDARKELGKYDLDGMVWNTPPPSLFPLIGEMIAEDNLPLIVPTLMFTTGGDRIPLPNNLITLDYEAVGKLRAEYCVKKGLVRVAYLGDDDDALTLNAFIAAFNASGYAFDWKWHIRNASDIPDRLPVLIDSENIDGIVSNGGADRLEPLFMTLEERGYAGRVEILPDFVPELPELLRRYANVKVNMVNDIPRREIGEIAATALIKQIRTGEVSPRLLVKTRLRTLNSIR